jgi:hypothetical protein
MDRALQYKKILVSDSDAIILFTALYKLMFLGTKFTLRVLQIIVQPGGVVKEGKIMVDTAELSSDGGAYLNSSGSEMALDTATPQSNYLKIKQHAVICLQTLFRNSNKAFALKGMWLLIFPSILTSPNPQQDTSFDTVASFYKNEMSMEPTLMQLAFSEEEDPKLKVLLI